MMRFRPMLVRLVLALILALVAVPALAEPSFPKLTGRVVDAANLLSPPQEAALVSRLEALEKQSGHQLVVATLPDLQGYDIADYGYQLGRAWGLGGKETNDGAILIVAPKERRVRIEVGYGLEPVLTDAFSSRTVQNVILPRFKADDYPGGIAAGTEAIAERIALPPEEAAKREQAAAQTQKPRGRAVNVGAFIFWIVVFFAVVLPMLMRAGRGRRYRGSSGIGEAILWTAINAAANSGRGGGGSSWGGGGGGGGFSGGGGSFGGGGASGGW